MKIGFIVHGSPHIGMGHIMRTLSLAMELRDRGAQVFYFSKYAQGLGEVVRQGFETVRMPAREMQGIGFRYGETDELQEDLEFIRTVLGEKQTDALIVDSYNVSKEFFICLKRLTKCLVYIDDLNRFLYPVDILVNGTVLTERMDYRVEHPGERLLLGLKYNLVRKEFCQKPARAIKPMVQDILITTGSSDPFDMTGKFLGFFENKITEAAFIKRLCFHVIVGGGFCKENQKGWDKRGVLNILSYENQSDLSTVMHQCDLAISSGGSTLYELAACGIPCLTFSYAENQVMQVQLMEEYGVVRNLGAYQEIEMEHFFKLLGELESVSLRERMADKALTLVDGRGSGRISDVIFQYLDML